MTRKQDADSESEASDYVPSDSEGSSSSDDDDEDEGDEEEETTAKDDAAPATTRYAFRDRTKNKDNMERGKQVLKILKRAISDNEESEPAPRKKARRDLLPNKLLPPLPFKVTNLKELIKLAEACQKVVYRDCQKLPDLLKPLQDLDALIGMDKPKEMIFRKVLSSLQSTNFRAAEFDHFVVTGVPGLGKTTLVGILATILAKMGRTAEDRVVKASAETLIAGYLGQTAPRTAAVIKSAFGGVLLIDEAQSLSDNRTSSSGDSFSKQCIDTLNRFLTEDGDKFVCVIAGYEEELKRDFFMVNPGLSRRFPNWIHLDKYTPAEMTRIFELKAKERKCTLDAKCNTWLTGEIPKVENRAWCKAQGGAMTVLVDKCIDAHTVRVFGELRKGCISMDDLKAGVRAMQTESAQSKSGEDEPPPNMYI